MNSVRILFVAVAAAGSLATACTQVHQLGQIEGGAGDASRGNSSSEDSGDSSDSSSTPSDSEVDTSSETSGGGEDTSDESDGQESDDTGGPIPEACEIVDLGGNEGLILDIVPQEPPWPTGVCTDIYVTNETPDPVIWFRDLRFGGQLQLEPPPWNTQSEELSPTDYRFRGVPSNNIVVLPDETVSFGCCMTCTP